MSTQTTTALQAFEKRVRQDPLKGPAADYWLQKLESNDPNNPEFRDRMIDNDWQEFRAGWLAAGGVP